jgi:hypothetical protein
VEQLRIEPKSKEREMRVHRLLPGVVAFAALLLVTGKLKAANIPHHDIRELVFQADTVIVGELFECSYPKDGTGEPVKIKVREVLRSSQVRIGDVVHVYGLSDNHLEMPFELRHGKKHEYAPFDKGLLFLEKPKNETKESTYYLVCSGVRCLVRDGTILSPYQFNSPGPAYLVPVSHPAVKAFFSPPQEELDWQSLLARTRAEIAAKDEAVKLQEITDPARRNRAIFKWFEQRLKRGQGIGEDKGRDWNSLENQLLYWILNSCIPEDCWKAVKLWANMNSDAASTPHFEKPSFGCPEGRDLLLRVALDGSQPDADRERALMILDLQRTVWPEADKEMPHIAGLDKEEQSSLIDSLIPLLRDERATIRQYAADAILCASSTKRGAPAELETKRGLSALADAYKVEREGAVCASLAEAILIIGGGKYWEDLSGNPLGILVEFRDFCRHNNGVEFSVCFLYGPSATYEVSTLVLEKTQNSQRVVDRCEWELGLHMISGSNDDASGFIGSAAALHIDYANLSPGKWRLTARGTVDKDGMVLNWTSVPATFTVPKLEEEGEEPANDSTSEFPIEVKQEKKKPTQVAQKRIQSVKKAIPSQAPVIEKKEPADDSNWFPVFLLIVVCIAAGAVIATVVIRRRRT